MSTDPVRDFNEHAYQTMGFDAQRQYPNEELCRFMGRNYFGVEHDKRHKISFLEIGCGAGSNIWMLAREGFDTYGIDLSSSALPLARRMLNGYGTKAHLQVANMKALPFPNRHFDCVLDVYSSYCVDEAGFRQTVQEVARVLKPDGRFFIYTPGKGSEAWKNSAPAEKIDGSTLSGILRETSAYYPSPYPFRFVSHAELFDVLFAHGMVVQYAETVTRTYRKGAELFEFIVAEARPNRNEHDD